MLRPLATIHKISDAKDSKANRVKNHYQLTRQAKDFYESKLLLIQSRTTT